MNLHKSADACYRRCHKVVLLYMRFNQILVIFVLFHSGFVNSFEKLSYILSKAFHTASPSILHMETWWTFIVRDVSGAFRALLLCAVHKFLLVTSDALVGFRESVDVDGKTWADLGPCIGSRAEAGGLQVLCVLLRQWPRRTFWKAFLNSWLKHG